MFKLEKKNHTFILFTEIFVPLEKKPLELKKNVLMIWFKTTTLFPTLLSNVKKKCFFPWLLTHAPSRP